MSRIKKIEETPVAPVKKKRVFKSKEFSKAAAKRNISDADLCKAAKEAEAGQCDDLGGGVYKKRINKNMDRTILLAKGGKIWIFAHLFQKNDKENISDAELESFKELAKVFATLCVAKIKELTDKKELLEICNDNEC